MAPQRYRAGRHALGVTAVALVAVTAAGCGGGGKARAAGTRPAASPSSTAVKPLARSVPSRLRIPKLNIDSPIMKLGLNADRTIQVPPLNRLNMTGWWKGGPTPGEKGASVILGHNIGNGRASVFDKLGTLRPGDTVRVTRDNGSVATFEITRLEQIAKSRFPTDKVYGKLSYPGIRLITCGGRFDSSSGHHVDNVIAYGRLVNAS
ncbi:class F sortase [Actinoallomurus bryophytorum]|uniref:LPXTG-site transpeptidase (Sortase) family protein n=1 Tax=Actinoallomurus bryophytorum TaxID=1490222 RepID=A0A543CS88_9ACTN|nr:class F sortase [Actinoallomurus bryophytorum]TQL99898.1 LPXTG-site transpeptidase (sortase) family protein [Actinoallomurus bryophytorum]